MDISSYGYMNHFSKDEDQGSDGSEKEAETLVDEIVEEEDIEEIIDDYDTEYEEVKDMTENKVETVDEEDIELVGEEKPMGRPTKLTDNTIKKLETALKIGLSQKKAAIYSGISERTFYLWQKKYKEIEKECNGDPDNIKNADDLDLFHFFQSIKKAKIDGELNHLGVITKAADNGVWQASAWFMERSNPEEWGRIEKNNDSDDEDGKRVITFKINYSS